MSLAEEYENLFKIAKSFGQEHIFRFYDQLNDEEKKNLINHVQAINFKELDENFKVLSSQKSSAMYGVSDLVPYPESEIGDSILSTDSHKKWWDLGLESISKGEVCALLLAGGQGTRLGVKYPKGMYDVNLPSHKSLFHLQAERILKLQKLASAAYGTTKPIPWYIMTSEATMNETQAFFKKENFFGLSEKDIYLFEQNTLPCIDFNGKIILSNKSTVAIAPNGNGGLYEIIEPTGILKTMKDRGVKYIFIYCVDNILVRICDPWFIGFCIDKKYDCCPKVVQKRTPDESVGVVCLKKGKYTVVEYSEMTDEAKQLTCPETGKLVYDNGSICNHFLTLDALEKVALSHCNDLEYHVAKKKVPYCDENGTAVQPTKNNGIKLERFIFDVFPLFENFGIYRVARDEEFSPLKNSSADKIDCPQTCRNDLLKYHTKLISKVATLTHPEKTTSVELACALSYAGEGLEKFKDQTLDNETDVFISKS